MFSKPQEVIEDIHNVARDLREANEVVTPQVMYNKFKKWYVEECNTRTGFGQAQRHLDAMMHLLQIDSTIVP